ncbi:MAG: hypothetical protein AB7G12_13825 [Thermoanaerobaculia bacterium]
MPSQDLEIAQIAETQPGEFAASALPLCIELARIAKRELRTLMPAVTEPFSFEDRVFLLLVPEMQHEVVRFYAGRGSNLAAQLKKHQLESLDRKLLPQLFLLLEKSYPLVAQALRIAANRLPHQAKKARRRRRRP